MKYLLNTLYILESATFQKFNNGQDTYGSCHHQAYSLWETDIKEAIAINKGKYKCRSKYRVLRENTRWAQFQSVLEFFLGGVKIEDEHGRIFQN